MRFKIRELEREPIDFNLELAPGAIDFGEGAAQQGPLETVDRALSLQLNRERRVPFSLPAP